MRILVVQLARLGDIYQSWPTVRALRRLHPTAEIDFLVRARFAEATRGLDVCRVLKFDSLSFLSPIVGENSGDKLESGVHEALTRIQTVVTELKSNNYDRVINLTFSPLSSYLVHQIAGDDRVRGYTRFDDGTLRIPDDPSAFFYAQVGVLGSSRIHLTHLFGAVAEVDLVESDWASGNLEVLPRSPRIVVHLGASQERKTLGLAQWCSVIRRLVGQWDGVIALVGSADEIALGEFVESSCPSPKLVNLVGRTTLPDLMMEIERSVLLVGVDSCPIHIASLTRTPVLNISIGDVNFYETGPLSPGSRVMRPRDGDVLLSEDIATEALSIVRGGHPRENVDYRVDYLGQYYRAKSVGSSFPWELIRALYMDGLFPVLSDDLERTALERLDDLNFLALEQLNSLKKNSTNQVAASILDRVDEMIKLVAKFAPSIAPLTAWFLTERMRIGPMPVQEMIVRTQFVHSQLDSVLRCYLGERSMPTEGGLDELNSHEAR